MAARSRTPRSRYKVAQKVALHLWNAPTSPNPSRAAKSPQNRFPDDQPNHTAAGANRIPSYATSQSQSCHRIEEIRRHLSREHRPELLDCLTNSDTGAQGKDVLSLPCGLMDAYFFGFRGACARSDAIGPRSRFGVLGLRKSFPACDASLLDVVMPFFS
jgi:hypothetical protein